MYAPHIKSARQLRRYRLGNYQALLFDQCEAVGPIRYLYVLVIFQEGERTPTLFVASEESDMPPALSPSPPFLGLFGADGHHNFGTSPDWADLEAFTARALQLAAEQ